MGKGMATRLLFSRCLRRSTADRRGYNNLLLRKKSRSIEVSIEPLLARGSTPGATGKIRRSFQRLRL
jgi:hypothetical protein